MNFERGQENIKEVLGIGKKANALRIIAVFYPDREIMKKGTKYKKREALLKSKLKDESARRILESIEKGEISSGWENQYFVAYFQGPLEKPSDLISAGNMIFSPLKDLKESFVELNGQKYLIP